MVKYYGYNKETSTLYVDQLIPTEIYYGYYNIDENGQAYKGKTTQKNPLSCVKELEHELNKSTYFKDRVLSEELKFPYSLNEILLNVNDPVTSSIFNHSIDMLYDNLLYLYANCYIADNYIPNNFLAWAGKSRILSGFDSSDTPQYSVSKFEWHPPTDPTPNNFSYKLTAGPDDDPININLINNIRDAVVFQQNNTYYLFAITSENTVSFEDDYYADRLACFKIIYDPDNDSYSFDIIINTQYIDDRANQDINTFNDQGKRRIDLQYSNEIIFRNLIGISSDNNRYIYVLDQMGNHVYVYDVFNIIYDDKIFKNRLLLYRIVGDDDALGNTNSKFISPQVVRYLNNKLIVIDTGDDSIKVFDSDLNWKQTSGDMNFKTNVPVDIMYDEINDYYYILTENGLLIKYNSDFYLEENIQSGIYLDPDERCIKIYQSYNNSNIAYVLTNRNVYKKFITKLDKNIGSFLFNAYNIVKDQRDFWNYNYNEWQNDRRTWYTAAENDINYYKISVKCLSFFPNSNNYDDIFVVINSRILRCREDINYYTLFTNNSYRNDFDVDFDIYTKDDCFIKNEYVQALTYNKSLYKLDFSINVFYEKIAFRPVSEYNSYKNLVIKNFEYVDIKSTYDYGLKIYDNEIVDLNVVNRILIILYNKMK